MIQVPEFYVTLFIISRNVKSYRNQKLHDLKGLML